MSARVSRRPIAAFAALVAAAGVACADDPAPVPPPETPAADAKPADPRAKYKLDTDRFIFTEVEYDTPVRGEDRNPGEFRAYNETVLHARQFPDAELRAAARRAITFRDLLSPAGRDFQFDLLYFEGRLKMLRDVKPTKPLAEAGVTALYEGWVFPTNAADPMCVLLTELPPGLEPSAEYPTPVPVSFAGYYFKLIQYESANTDPKLRVRRAPLLIARTLTAGPIAAGTDEGGDVWWSGFLPGMLAMFVLVGSAAAGLTWFFRRGDRAHKKAIADYRERNNPFGNN